MESGAHFRKLIFLYGIIISLYLLGQASCTNIRIRIPFRNTDPDVKSENGMKECSDASQPGILVDPEDCGAYFSCNGHFYVRQNCPHGLHFDVLRNECIHPHKSKLCPNKRAATFKNNKFVKPIVL